MAKTIAEFCTFEIEQWSGYEESGFLVRLDDDQLDRRRVSFHSSSVPAQIWFWLLGARIAVVTAPVDEMADPVLTRDALRDWVDPAEVDALVAEIETGFGIA